MRSFLAFLLGVVALVLTAAATPALWAERHVVSSSGYVALTEPLGDDPGFQDALASTLVDAVLQRSALPDAVAERSRPVLTQLAGGLSDLPGYAGAWTETNRRSHALVFDRGSDQVAVDVSPLAQLLADQGGERLGLEISVPSSLPVVVGDERERAAVDDVASLDPRAWYLTGAAVLVAVLCVLAARRRSTAALWLGLGTLAVAGLLKAAAVVALPVVVARLDAPSDLGTEVLDLLERAAAESFDAWLLALAGLGLVLVVLGGIARVVSGRRDPSPA